MPVCIYRIAFSICYERLRNYFRDAGWSSLVARQAHNLKAAGSNPAPATKSPLLRFAFCASPALFARGENPRWHGQLVGSWVRRVLVSKKDAAGRSARLVRAAFHHGGSQFHLLLRA